MEVFDQRHVAFVSVTQQFNSATSMSRLVLHIVVWFAPFEREMIDSRRTANKMSAARKKGNWVRRHAHPRLRCGPKGWAPRRGRGRSRPGPRGLKTYTQIACEIVGAPMGEGGPILRLAEKDAAFGRRFAEERGIEADRPVIGINTGGGGRWRLKRWTEKGLEGLIEGLRLLDIQTVLLGGLAEEELNRRLLFNGPVRPPDNRRRRFNTRNRPGPIDGGCRNSLREFASLIGLCDLLVTGDSLALHMAVALKKKVVALFGPTSAAEIDLCGRGAKILPALDCLCCYRPTCDRVPNCMDSISVHEVLDAVQELL